MKRTPPLLLFQVQAGAGKSPLHATQCFPPPILEAQGRAVVHMRMTVMWSAVRMTPLTRGE